VRVLVTLVTFVILVTDARVVMPATAPVFHANLVMDVTPVASLVILVTIAKQVVSHVTALATLVRVVT
jgi:hypothetical protein